MIIKSFIAIGAGLISFLSPCVLPIIPGYISYITGKKLDEIQKNRRVVLLKTIVFSLGFSVVFISLGIAASFIGNVLIFFGKELRIAAGLIIILFSLNLLGIINFNFLNQDKRFEKLKLIMPRRFKEKRIIINPAAILSSLPKKINMLPRKDAAIPKDIKTAEKPKKKTIVLSKTTLLFF